ncbi:zinc-binding alcohol dehydrogenase [Flavobacteriaceae bacterium 3-367]
MKIKEIPVSIFHTLKLLSLSATKLRLNEKKEVPVIVSLTSIPSRLGLVHLVIRSLMDQEVRPKKIVLWLNKTLKDSIPKKLGKLEGDLFEIRFSALECSHRKLIHSLDAFPSEIIITCDDDLIYRRNWLRLLFEAHQDHPNRILANQTRYISYDQQGKLLPYKQWIYRGGTPFNADAVLPLGAGGVLYPPGTLLDKTGDIDLFMDLAPKADDLWFKAMSYLKGTTSSNAGNAPKKPIPIMGSQVQSLKKQNVDQDKNRSTWEAVSAHFEIDLSRQTGL